MTHQWATLNAEPVQLWAKPEGPQTAAAGVMQPQTCSLQQTLLGQVCKPLMQRLSTCAGGVQLEMSGVQDMLDVRWVVHLSWSALPTAR